MRLSSLIKLFSGQLPASEYSAEIATELAEHTRGLAVRGGVAPVRVTEDTDLLLDRAALGTLCRLFANGQLTAQELAYTADALQMAERVEFSGQDIATDLAQCTDPEINGPLTVARALEIASAGTAA
jgi:hypothetical protein